MTTQRTARLIAAIAAPLFLLHAAPARCGNPAGADRTAIQLSHISIEILGKGAPVILIPGLSSPRQTYEGLAQSLAATHRVYLVQVNGFGGDDARANTGPGVLDGVVADLHDTVARNGMSGVAVIGHSLGGLVGLMLARAHPGDVGRLMVVDTLPYIGDIFVPGAQVAQVEPRARTMRDAIVAQYGHPANVAGAAAMAATMALHEESRRLVAGWIVRADPRVTGEALYEDMTTDLRPQMASISLPITLVYPFGGEMPRDKANAFYKAEYAGAPDVTFVPVEASGHFVMLDQPGAFEKAVIAFLAT